MTALSNLHASILLLISIVLLASLILARKRPLIFIGYLFALLGRLFGVLLKPIVIVLRALRLISRQTEATGSSVYGPGVLVGLAHFFLAETETDREIANNFDTGSVDIARNRGLVCFWLRPEEIQPDAQKEYDKVSKIIIKYTPMINSYNNMVYSARDMDISDKNSITCFYT